MRFHNHLCYIWLSRYQIFISRLLKPKIFTITKLLYIYMYRQKNQMIFYFPTLLVSVTEHKEVDRVIIVNEKCPFTNSEKTTRQSDKQNIHKAQYLLFIAQQNHSHCWWLYRGWVWDHRLTINHYDIFGLTSPKHIFSCLSVHYSTSHPAANLCEGRQTWLALQISSWSQKLSEYSLENLEMWKVFLTWHRSHSCSSSLVSCWVATSVKNHFRPPLRTNELHYITLYQFRYLWL